MGDISSVRIGHNDKGIGAGWFLMKVIVKNQATGTIFYKTNIIKIIFLTVVNRQSVDFPLQHVAR